MSEEHRWMLAQKALNQIDDGFEYRYGDEKARAFVHKVLAEYTAAIQTLPPSPPSEVAPLRARIAALEAALAPFAKAEAHEDLDFPDDQTLVEMLTGDRITLGDLRRARSVLSEMQS